VLRGARAAKYDIVLTSETPEHELSTYDRYVNDNSVDGFIIDLPRENDARVDYLLKAGRPFVVHGREARSERYGWVDVDNYGNFYRLTRLLIANGHRHIAFINGDERFNYALYRRHAVLDALEDNGLTPSNVTILNSLHPMGDAGYKLTKLALQDEKVTAVIYSSILMAIEGNAAIQQAGNRDIAIATMDDELHYLDLSQIIDRLIFVRSSLRDAGIALIEELARQCDKGIEPRGTLMPSVFHVLPGMDAKCVDYPLPEHRLVNV
jgi:LacI family transcriptional regulator